MVRVAMTKKMMLRDRAQPLSTTPKSARGRDPDECDRMMGISLVNPFEGGRFGDGDLTDTEDIEEGVANASTTLIVLVLTQTRGVMGVLASWNALTDILVECLALPPLLPAPLREHLGTLGLSPTRDRL